MLRHLQIHDMILTYLIIGLVIWRFIDMRRIKRQQKRKEYQVAKSRKYLQRRTRNNKRAHRRKLKLNAEKHISSLSFTGKPAHILKAPSRLSISQNTVATLVYFSSVINMISSCKVRDVLFFDLSEVDFITPDAIMYLIALIKNTRRIRSLHISCRGSLPRSNTAREVVEQSGFSSFMYSQDFGKVERDKSYMKISTGKEANSELAGNFCDFVQKSCGITIQETKRLYPTIIELMTNTHQHAYRDEQTIMMSNWYIFAQDLSRSIHFVFLDTGAGIPRTVAKKFTERIKDLMLSNDAMYLESALRGMFRSETKQEHRGKGLPGIYEDACNGEISNLCIISGHGK